MQITAYCKEVIIFLKCNVIYILWNQQCLHIYLLIIYVLAIYRQIRHFEHDYHWFTAVFIKKSMHLKYQKSTFLKEQQATNYVNSLGIVKFSSHQKVSPHS